MQSPGERTFSTENNGYSTKSYSPMRHRVADCHTFGSFARRLAEEWKDANDTEPTTPKRYMSSEAGSLTPTFRRNAAERFRREKSEV